jgi:hypothetical protein
MDGFADRVALETWRNEEHSTLKGGGNSKRGLIFEVGLNENRPPRSPEEYGSCEAGGPERKDRGSLEFGCQTHLTAEHVTSVEAYRRHVRVNKTRGRGDQFALKSRDDRRNAQEWSEWATVGLLVAALGGLCSGGSGSERRGSGD